MLFKKRISPTSLMTLGCFECSCPLDPDTQVPSTYCENANTCPGCAEKHRAKYAADS